MVQELVDGGTFLLNCAWDMEGLEKHLPGQVKAFIANHDIKFYTIDGVKIGIETGMGPTRIKHNPSVCILQTYRNHSGRAGNRTDESSCKSYLRT